MPGFLARLLPAREKAAVEPMTLANSNGAFGSGGWFGVIRESFSGAWQSHLEVDSPKDILAFSAVYSCVSLIAGDIAKLQPRLMVRAYNGNTWSDNTAGLPIAAPLRKPNHFQTRAQFITDWITSKLLHGNTFVLKERDSRRAVVALYVLNADRVKTLVAVSGDVYYELGTDHLSGLQKTITVPASEVIHDRGTTPWHPLVGVSPITACGMSATVGNRIQNNAGRFFENMSRPSGMLTAPATISDEVAARLKAEFETAFSGRGLGRLFVGGDGLAYHPMTINAIDAQLIEQLRWTTEDVARCFHVPIFKLGGPAPAGLSVEAQQQLYLADALQGMIESLEQCLDAGLELPAYQRTELDLDGLLRMDTAAQFEALGKAVGGGWMSPNEARERVNLAPVAGGSTPYLQVQNFSLAALDRRDSNQAAPNTGGGPAGGKGFEAVEGPPGRDGLEGPPGRDALDLEILSMIDPDRKYQRHTYARHKGGIFHAFRATDPLRDSAEDKAGWECMVNGIDEEFEEALDEGRTLVRTTRYSDGRELVRVIRTALVIDRGIFKAGTDYAKGDGVTFGGSYWIKQADGAVGKPGEDSGWRCAVKRGRDGKDGKLPEEPAPLGPVRLA